jgi:thioredoxin 2
MTRTCPACDTTNRLEPERLHEVARCGRCKNPISPLDIPYRIHGAEEFDAIVARASLPVVVDFWATWCGPCVQMAPEIGRLARDEAGKLLVAKLDTGEVPGVAERFAIRGIPTLILFRGGQEAGRSVGAMPAEGIRRTLGL